MGYNVSNADVEYMGDLVLDVARELFTIAGYEHDFCIQAVGESVVFGGTNRVLWHPLRGFKIDKPYCSDKFIQNFENAVGEYK